MKFKFRGEWRGHNGRVKVYVFFPRKFTGGGWIEE